MKTSTKPDNQTELFSSPHKKANIVVVDDEELTRFYIERIVESVGCSFIGIDSASKARDYLLNNRADLLLLDINLNGENGLGLLGEMREKGDATPVIIISAVDQIEPYKTAVRLGATDYLIKPFEQEELRAKIQTCLARTHKIESADLKRWAKSGVIGQSPKLLSAMLMAEVAANSKLNVLIIGESGSGKEKFARAVHDLSPRSEKRFIAVNSAGIDDNLLNSELFGYRKGAFTGADSDRPGLIKEADGGTLFLDEIGDLGLTAQVKLLRVIETGSFFPVGDTRIQTSDIRYVAATHHYLEKDVEMENFRLDLFYRLKGFEIIIPALRERTEDIPILVEHFLSRDNQALNFQVHPDVFEAMMQFDWPGNVRQLENMVTVAKARTKDQALKMEHFPELCKKIRANSNIKTPVVKNVKKEIAGVEKLNISHALAVTKGNVFEAAKLLGMTKSTLYRKIKKYDIPPVSTRQ
jgi:DNA-binding NtrC family response regulator